MICVAGANAYIYKILRTGGLVSHDDFRTVRVAGDAKEKNKSSYLRECVCVCVCVYSLFSETRRIDIAQYAVCITRQYTDIII